LQNTFPEVANADGTTSSNDQVAGSSPARATMLPGSSAVEQDVSSTLVAFPEPTIEQPIFNSLNLGECRWNYIQWIRKAGSAKRLKMFHQILVAFFRLWLCRLVFKLTLNHYC